MYYSEKNKGAFLNNHRLRVSKKSSLDDCLFSSNHEGVKFSDLNMRYSGCAALDLAYVAAGRFDGFWETGLQPWDIAAGIVIVREAGGMVTELDGRDRMLESGSILAVNPNLYQELGQILKKAGK